MFQFVVLSFLPLISFSGQEISAKRQEISAKHWFNNPEYRLFDDRDVILFFFDAGDRQSARWISKLERLRRRPDVVVIGLTQDDKNKAELFIKREKVRFTVGAGSPSAKSFGVRALPALRKFVRKDPAGPRIMEMDGLADYLPSWGDYGKEEVEAIKESWELAAFVESDAYGMNRQQALFKLFDTWKREEFLALAQARLPVERDPWVRNALKLLIDRAQGVDNPQPKIAASTEYRKQFSADQDDSAWAPFREYQKEIHQRTVAQLVDDYRIHGAEEPNDVLIRRTIAAHLEQHDRTAARRAYMELLLGEPDYFIRLRIVGGLNQTCQIGDEEAAAFLEEAARAEPNLRHVKPLMEYTSHYLRTGEEDTRDFPLPP